MSSHYIPNIIRKIKLYPLANLILLTLLVLIIIINNIILKEKIFLIPLILISIVLWILSYKNEIVSICIILLLFVHTIEQSKDISVLEIIIAFYIYLFLFYWFISKIIIQKSKVIKSTTDLLLLLFWSVSLLSILITISNNGSFIYGLRELLTITLLLLYFPMRSAMKNMNNRKIIISFFLLMVSLIVIYNLVEYISNIQNAQYLWQLVSERQHFGVNLFTVAPLFTIGLISSTNSKYQYTILSLVFLITTIALAITFSRGFWIALILGLVIFFIFSNKNVKKRIIKSILLVTIIILLLSISLEINYLIYLKEVLQFRLGTIKSGIQDLSVAERLNEYKSVINLISQNPFSGYGFGATFSHYNIIEGVTQESLYIHNGFLYITFKVGILGAILFFSFYYTVISNGILIFKKNRRADYTDNSILLSSITVLVAILVISISSGVFANKHALISLALASSVIMSYCHDNLK